MNHQPTFVPGEMNYNYERELPRDGVELPIAEGVEANASYTLYSLQQHCSLPRVSREDRWTRVRELPRWSASGDEAEDYGTWAARELRTRGVYRVQDAADAMAAKLCAEIRKLRREFKEWKTLRSAQMTGSCGRMLDEENGGRQQVEIREGMNLSPLHEDDDLRVRGLIAAAEQHLKAVHEEKGRNAEVDVLFISWRTRGIGPCGRKTYLNHWHTDFDKFHPDEGESRCHNGEEVIEEFLLSWLPLWLRRAEEKGHEERRCVPQDEESYESTRTSSLKMSRDGGSAISAEAAEADTTASVTTSSPASIQDDVVEVDSSPCSTPLSSSRAHPSPLPASDFFETTSSSDFKMPNFLFPLSARDVIRKSLMTGRTSGLEEPQELDGYENLIREVRKVLREADHDVCNLWFTLAHDKQPLDTGLCLQSKPVFADSDQDGRLLDEYFSEVAGTDHVPPCRDSDLLCALPNRRLGLPRTTRGDGGIVEVVDPEEEQTHDEEDYEVSVLFRSMEHSHRSCDLRYAGGVANCRTPEPIQRNNMEARFLVLRKGGLAKLRMLGRRLFTKYFTNECGCCD
eukprot:g7408.t1